MRAILASQDQQVLHLKFLCYALIDHFLGKDVTLHVDLIIPPVVCAFFFEHYSELAGLVDLVT